MLDLNSVDVSIGSLKILNQVNLHVPEGQMIGLIGRNGAGKTTIMHSIMGHRRAQRGAIMFGGIDLVRMPAHARAGLGIGYMPEDRKLVPDFTSEQNILLPAWAIGNSVLEERLRLVYDLIPETKAFCDRHASKLSGGQQKLVALARALICGQNLLLLDEPFEGVAPVLARRLAEVISDLKSSKISCLIADSNQQHLEGLLDGMVKIERGVIVDCP